MHASWRLRRRGAAHFEEKLVDVVGLYLDLSEHAIVLSVDGKSQIHALDRTQPRLPMKKGPGPRGQSPRMPGTPARWLRATPIPDV